MGRERCVLPVKCEQCQRVFDLWYDLQAQEENHFFARSTAKSAQSLCWECRNDGAWEIQKAEDAQLGEYEIILSFE